MIRDGGKDGVIAFRSTVRRLYGLVEAAKDEFDPAKGNGNPQRGFHHPRTMAALEEVAGTCAEWPH